MSIAAPTYKRSWYNDVIREKNNSDEYGNKIASNTRNKHKLKLDQIMKVLFKLSKKVTLNMINRIQNLSKTIMTASLVICS